MNEASQWRYAFAQRVAVPYTSNAHVAAIILGGSSARGHADRFSDIEVGVFWYKPPTEQERRSAIQTAGGDLVALFPYDPHEEVWADDVFLGRRLPDQPKSGILVEVVHYTTDFVQRTLDSVLVHHDPDELKQNLIAGIADARILYSPHLVEQWQAQALHYPPELAHNVIKRHAQIDHFWRWQMWLQRGPNLSMLYQSYAQVQQKILHVLLGLNHVFYFGFKWLDVVIGRLSISPPQLIERFQQVYQGEPSQGAHILTALVDETYDLIAEHHPEINVQRLRQIFHYERPVWAKAPPN